MQVVINLSKEEIKKLENIMKIRDEHDIVRCIHEIIGNVKNNRK